MLAVAGGAWALFGRDDNKTPSAIGPKVSTAAPAAPPALGPVLPGTTAKPAATVKPTSVGPVAATASSATKPAATKAPTAAPTKAAATTTATVAPTKAPAPAAAATKPPVVTPPVVTPPAVTPAVTAPQRGGTVAAKAYTFKVARGDTLWSFTRRTLAKTGRATSNANVTAYVDKLFAQNRGVIGSNPNLIVPGQTIVWPSGL